MQLSHIQRVLTIAAFAVLAAGCTPKSGSDADSSPMGAMTDAPQAEPGKTGTGVGVITAIDARAGTVTVKHEAIADVGWPAMTMTFTAKPASVLNGAKVGERVRFGVSLSDAGADVTSIRPQG